MSSPISRVEALPSRGWPSSLSLQLGELEERSLRRICNELHDGPAQLISLALLNLSTLMPSGPERTRAEERGRAVSKIQASLQQAMQELRAMSAELAPSLDELSLSDVIRSAVSHHERRTGVPLAVALHPLPDGGRLALKIGAYRFVEEALRLVSLRAKGARSELEVSHTDGLLCLDVIVDAQPIEAEGLLDLQDPDFDWLRRRVETRGGQFEIESLRGAETRLSARFSVNERIAFHD